MGILIRLKDLKDEDMILEGELTPEELEMPHDDECVDIKENLHYYLIINRQGDDILVRGILKTALDCVCVRCLKAFKMPLNIRFDDLLALEGEDKVEVKDDSIDLTYRVREDTLLAYPQHPLCEKGCDRLPNDPSHRVDYQKLGSDAELQESSSAWNELDKLKLE